MLQALEGYMLQRNRLSKTSYNHAHQSIGPLRASYLSTAPSEAPGSRNHKDIKELIIAFDSSSIIASIPSELP
jgi:hypothetical protein